MKNWLRRGLVGLAAVAALAGCGDSVSSRNINGPEETAKVTSAEEGRERLMHFAGNNEGLANMVGEAYRRMLAAPKPAQDSEVLQIPYNGRNPGDFDYNHEIDFDDFLLFADNFGISNKDYDLDGDEGLVDFDDFLLFADNFGRRVNSIPQVTGLESSNGNEANVGDEVEFSAAAEDRENDSLNYSWLINNEEIGVNGRILKRIFDKPGEYLVAVNVSDPFGAKSNELSRVLNVQHLAPVLSLPDEISFPQWVSGQNIGNVHNVNLDDYVEDPNFSDSELSWNFEVENNDVEHNKENTAPFGQWLGWLRDSWASKALYLTLNDNRILTIDPVANYNSDDHGDKYVNFTVTNPNGVSANKKVKVNVRRSAEFDGQEGFDDVITGGLWAEPPEKVYIWTGNIKLRGDPIDPRLWSGPETTQEQINNYRRVFEMLPEISNFFKPLEIIETNDYRNIYDESTNLLSSPDQTLSGIVDQKENPASTGVGYTLDVLGYPTIKSCDIAVASRARFSDIVHEIGHCTGPHHPRDDGKYDLGDNIFNETIFIRGTNLETPSAKDKAVVDSAYELIQYN